MNENLFTWVERFILGPQMPVLFVGFLPKKGLCGGRLSARVLYFYIHSENCNSLIGMLHTQGHAACDTG